MIPYHFHPLAGFCQIRGTDRQTELSRIIE